jgi:hypothetical protein
MKGIFFTIGLGIAIFTANAQTTSPLLVCSAGDIFTNKSYQLDWSIGELLTETFTVSENMLTQGFHQSSYIITALENSDPGVNLSVYPNPTADLINIKLSGFENGLNCTVTDFSGRVLQTVVLKSDLEQIDLSNCPVGNYLISVQQKKRLIGSFKIIKK